MSTKHGGKRENSGRKSKASELELIEKLSPLDKDAFDAIKKGVKNGEFNFIKLFMEYRFGKPKESLSFDDEVIIKLVRE